MMRTQYERTQRVIGEDGLAYLQKAKVLLFGVGGVGSYVGEALIRAGVGQLTLVDRDVVDVTNINRQLIALHSTVGMDKVSVAAQRYRDIAPEATIIPIKSDVTPENVHDFHVDEYDYVLDAIDTVSAKIAIIEACYENHVPVISCMGTGNKMDPSAFKVAPIEKTSVCPLAKVMRRALKVRGIKGIKVVYSEELPVVRANPPGSVSFVPGAAGLIMAGEVIRFLCKGEENA